MLLCDIFVHACTGCCMQNHDLNTKNGNDLILGLWRCFCVRTWLPLSYPARARSRLAEPPCREKLKQSRLLQERECTLATRKCRRSENLELRVKLGILGGKL